MDLSDLPFLIGVNTEDMAWWQMSVRAVLIFAYGILLVRVSGKRTFGKLSAFDIVLAIIIGSNLSRTLTGDSPFLATLIATTLLAVLHLLLARLVIRVRWLSNIVKGSPRQVIRDGKVDESAMRRGALWRGDLDQALRQHGLETTDGVKAAYLERDGSISIIKRPSGSD